MSSYMLFIAALHTPLRRTGGRIHLLPLAADPERALRYADYYSRGSQLTIFLSRCFGIWAHKTILEYGTPAPPISLLRVTYHWYRYRQSPWLRG